MMIIEKIHDKYIYWKHKLEERKNLNAFCKGHQVKLYNWSRPFPQDLWLINFIEQRGLLKDKPQGKIGLYSIFAPYWLHHFDGCNIRIFVERENLHKPSMQKWLHRFLNDDSIQLSLGFDRLDHPYYMRLPFG